MRRAIHDTFLAALGAARSPVGGWGPRPGAPAEAEPTALACLALDDARGRAWLEADQRPDGAFGLIEGRVRNDSSTALGALALPPGPARERALDHLVASRAGLFPSNEATPHSEEVQGWGWTPQTFAWVEPTSRALLALRRLRPTARLAIDDAVGTLADRECVGGGWNYGNRVVLAEELEPFGQTTAVALLGLQGSPGDLTRRGVDVLQGLWRREQGGLTLAQAAAALRLLGEDVTEVEVALAERYAATAFLDDVVALAWAAIATGPRLDRLRIPS
ncbi:MAG: hypothetical protein IPM45_08770 [Acidimicrobiales bacterium]|nr:hypothetical protein [Acidimicrobiales bacterium]